jgi:type IV pilus assembly protein PilV
MRTGRRIVNPVKRARARGFSIVEALVALVVLSIGMLGIAALYVESLRAGRSAIYRTQAVNLATDLADRIRANRRGGQAYRLDGAAQPPSPGTCAPTRTTASANCTPAQLATDDLARWSQAIRQQLPAGPNGLPRGTVSVNPAGTMFQYSIEITWSEPGEPVETPFSYVLNMQI